MAEFIDIHNINDYEVLTDTRMERYYFNSVKQLNIMFGI